MSNPNRATNEDNALISIAFLLPEPIAGDYKTLRGHIAENAVMAY
jgi:hypothetical protein